MAMTDQECKDLFETADYYGKIAANEAQDQPFDIVNRANGKTCRVPGMCGFGWVKIKPANCKFAKWMKANGYADIDTYQGGMSYWISDYGQSYEKKRAYAYAFADQLKRAGMKKVYPGSRLD